MAADYDRQSSSPRNGNGSQFAIRSIRFQIDEIEAGSIFFCYSETWFQLGSALGKLNKPRWIDLNKDSELAPVARG
jgi:hypothetical protein